MFCLQARTRELENLQHTVEELQAKVHSMDGAKGWFERRLKETEVSWRYLVKVQSWLGTPTLCFCGSVKRLFFLLDCSSAKKVVMHFFLVIHDNNERQCPVAEKSTQWRQVVP